MQLLPADASSFFSELTKAAVAAGELDPTQLFMLALHPKKLKFASSPSCKQGSNQECLKSLNNWLDQLTSGGISLSKFNPGGEKKCSYDGGGGSEEAGTSQASGGGNRKKGKNGKKGKPQACLQTPDILS